MGELIDFKSKKIINKVNKIDKPQENKQLTIEFLEDIIKGLKNDKLDPEKCLVLTKWKKDESSESYEYYHNNLPTETILSMLKLCEDLFIKDICN